MMRTYSFYRWFPLLLAAAMALAGCSSPVDSTAIVPPAAQIAATQGSAPTPAVAVEKGGVDDPNVFVDPEPFKAALLQALMDQDQEKLLRWMSSDFSTGYWRADGSYGSPADGLRELYANYLGKENRLEWVKGANLKALLGERDPLSFGRADAGTIEAALSSGWGKGGRDEMVLFIARAADNSLKWNGWMFVQGGFSGARLGGIQSYTNQANGYRVYLPKGYEVVETNADTVLVMAPGVGHPGQTRAAAFIYVEPANGQDVNAVVEQAKADAGPGFEIPPGSAMGLDKAMSITLSGLPGQDVNRQLFVVYNDRLYHITFVPDTAKAGASYEQMEDLYAMITNTWYFTR